MAWAHAGRIKETSTTTGTGTLTLIAPSQNNLVRFNSRWTSGTKIPPFVIAGSTYFEINSGTLTVSGGTHTLTRDSTPMRSSNSDALVSLPAGTHDVFPCEPFGVVPPVTFTTTLTLTIADLGNLAIFTGSSTGTLNLPALASTFDGYTVFFRNDGTAAFTIDPSGSEAINGGTTQSVAVGEGGILLKTSTKWVTIAPFGAAYLANANVFTANQTINTTAAFGLAINCADAGAGALGGISLYRNSASPAAGDILNEVRGDGNDSGGNFTNYASMIYEIVSPTNGAETGRMRIRQMRVGSPIDWFWEGGSLYHQGNTVPSTAGTINAVAYQRNNVALPNQRSFTSTDQAISSGGLITVAHGLGVAPDPFDVRLSLVCLTANNGWAVDDVVSVQTGHIDVSTTGNMGTAVYTDATNIYVRMGSNAGAFALLNKTTGTVFIITNANWALRIRAYA